MHQSCCSFVWLTTMGRQASVVSPKMSSSNTASVFFFKSPMLNSLIGFVNQSLHVGVGLMPKHFCNRWYVTNFQLADKKHDYSRTVRPATTPKNKLACQIFTLLNAHASDSDYTSFAIGYVLSIEDNLTAVLKRDFFGENHEECAYNQL